MKAPYRNFMAVGLVSSLLCAVPLQVQAAPTLTVTAKDTPKSKRAAHKRGKQAALAGDAQTAVSTWTELLASTPESNNTRRFRMKLIVDTIAVALDAHTAEPNVALLESALDTYYAYFSAYEAQYGNPNIPGPVVKARFELKSALEAAEEPTPPPPPPAPEPASDEPSPPPPSSATPPPDDGGGFHLSTADAERGDGTGLMIAGGITMVAGVGLTSLIAVGAINRKNARKDLDNPAYSDAQRARITDEEKKANTMFIAGLASAPVALITGGVLLGVGAKRRSDTKRGYASLTPTVTRNFAGLRLQGKF